MKSAINKISLLLTVLLICPKISYGAWIWTPETGKWINPKHAVKDSAEEQFKYAMGLYDGKEYKRAVQELDKLIRYYPGSSHAPDAQYYTGRSYEDMEEYYHSYLAYQKMIEAYPYAKNRDEVIKRQFDIGMRFFNGEKAKVMGVALLPATDKAVEIFEQVVRNSPYGEYADKAQYKIGEAYKNTGRFAEATVAFQTLADEYPKSELINEANYQIAQCAYLASLNYAYDQGTTDKAIEKFEEFTTYAADNEELSREAQENLKRLREKRAMGLFETARFYEKIGQFASAAIYYKDIADKYPDSSLAKEAVTKVMEIDKKIKKR